ncbi:dihydrofolate reductase family protein [Nocardioides caldifontis]|uniref:dihydrofolate reductase family protein n=1 Tax=Nocardioides caldifontis TaxID=2588938 RepID=UPI0011E02BD1|nr:dihydrofolate reductase family protein [Nocardioides caldifontis]
MSASYTFDIFMTLDGYGSYGPGGDWGGYWGKHGPELLEHRLAQVSEDQRMVLGGATFREFSRWYGPESGELAGEIDPVNAAARALPTTVISSTLDTPLDWPDATLEKGDAVETVARLKDESPVPLRSHGSISLNRSLMAAGLVDRVQVTVFPVVSGRTGERPIFERAADFDLELLSTTVLDGRTLELVYRPTLHGGPA